MTVSRIETISGTDIERARAQFESIGHVGLTGLIDADLEAAAIDARSLYTKEHLGGKGEHVATLRSAPTAEKQPALRAVLDGVETGAALLGRDITPSLEREKPHIQLLMMAAGAKGRLHRDNSRLTDVVAIANLRGASNLWFEDAENPAGVSYTIHPGDIVLHDLQRKLLHRGSATPEEPRVGLAVAKLQVQTSARR